MTTSNKAKRGTVAISPLSADGFHMPDGSYWMSQTQAAKSEGKPEINARRFLDSRGIKTSRGEAYTPDSIEGHDQIQQLRNAGLEPWQLPQDER